MMHDLQNTGTVEPTVRAIVVFEIEQLLACAEVVHLVAQQLFDLSGVLSGLADRDVALKLPAGRGDEFAHGGGPDPRDTHKPAVRPKEMHYPDLRIETLKVKAQNFH